VIGLPLVIWVVNYGGLPLLLACTALALVGLRELYIAFSQTDKAIHIVGYLFTIGYYVTVFFFGPGYWLLISLTLFIITIQTCLVIFFKRLPLQDCITTVYGFLYVPFLLSFIILVREHELGTYYVWLIFTSSFGCDTFAYLTGRAFGRNKLKGSPSPSKSVEGLIGGTLGAALLGLLYGFFISRFIAADADAVPLIIIHSTVISLIGAIFCIIGDMAASAIKRHTKIKDFGKLFPGHGGVIDRTDGMMIVAPIVYMAMNILIWIGSF